MNLPFYDLLADAPVWASVIGVLVVFVALGFVGAPLWLWAVAGRSSAAAS